MKNKCKKCKYSNALPGKYCEFCGQETGIREKRYAKFQTLDRALFQKTQSHFPTGEETVRAFTYKKKKAPAVIAVLLVFFLLAGSAFGSYYFGLWERFLPTNPPIAENCFRIADGRRISASVINAPAAKSAINEVKGDFSIRDAEIELAENGSVTIDSDTYYRFTQVYETVPVFGRSMVVHTDKDGAVYSVTGNFCPITDLSVTPSIRKEKAAKKLASFVRNEFSYTEDSYSVTDNGLMIYAPNMTDQILAYAYEISGVTQDGKYECYEILLSAKNGTPLYWRDTQNYFELPDDNEAENPRVIQVEGNESQYQFADTGRNIQVYSPMGGNLSDVSVQNSSDSIDLGISFDALYNASLAYDYYKDILGLASFDGQESALSLITNIPETNHTFDTASAFGSSIAFFPTSSNKKSAASATDIVGHEYTHLVLDHCVGRPMTDTAQAIFESFCDILGNTIEHKSGADDPEWELGEATGNAKYSMKTPSGAGLKNTVSSFGEDAAPAENASILSYAAYLTYTGASVHGYSPEETAVSDLDLLGKLWYRAMLLMPADADFSSAATALNEASHSMFQQGELSAAQLFGVTAALEAIGAEPVLPIYRVSANPTVSVVDSIGESYQTGHLVVTDQGTQQEVLSVPIETDRTELKLAPGSYLLTLSDRDAPDSNPIYRFQLEVGPREEALQEELPGEFTLYTWFNAKDYIDVLPGGVISVTGTVVGELWTDEAGEEHMAWVLALTEPLHVRMITESGTVNRIYNDQVAVGLISDHVDFSAYTGAEVTVSGVLIQKYSDIHRRDLCLENAYVGSADPAAEKPEEEETEEPEE